jgi:hypothetical protein
MDSRRMNLELKKIYLNYFYISQFGILETIKKQYYRIFMQEEGMPQISLHIDEITLKQVESAAERRHISISKWVAEQIRTRLEPVYPIHYEELFGSIADDTFTRPDETLFVADNKREDI